MKKLLLPVLMIVVWMLPGNGTAAGPIAPDGKTEVMLDVPVEIRMWNSGGIGRRGPGTGAGLCVFTSVEVAGRFQGCRSLLGFQEKMKHEPGGGRPNKLDFMIQKHAPGTQYLQAIDADLDFVRLCLKNGYLVATTCMGGQHMRNLVHLDDRWACSLDNNSPYEKGPNGEKRDTKLIWQTVEEYRRDANFFGAGIWIVVVLDKGPIQGIPVNAQADDGPAPAAPEYVWKFVARDKRLYLCTPAGRIVGCYEPWSDNFWYIEPGNRWYGPLTAPLDPPALPTDLTRDRVLSRVTDCGVMVCDMDDSRPGYRHNGMQIDRKKAVELIQQYARGLRVSVLGSPEMCSQVEADWNANPVFEPYRGKVVFRTFQPGDPLAVGLAPGVTVQAPPDAQGKGKVLFRVREYRTALLAESLRKADPNYDPERDPDPAKVPTSPRHPQPEPVMDPGIVNTAAAGGVGGLIVGGLTLLISFLRNRRKEQEPQQPEPTPSKPGTPVIQTGNPMLDFIIGMVVQAFMSQATERIESTLKGYSEGLAAKFLDIPPIVITPNGPDEGPQMGFRPIRR